MAVKVSIGGTADIDVVRLENALIAQPARCSVSTMIRLFLAVT